MNKLEIIGIALFLFLVSSFFIGNYRASIKPNISLNENILFELVQDWRSENNLPTYTKSKKLCEITDIRVEQIQTYYSHSGFRDLYEQNLKDGRYWGYEKVSENLVYAKSEGEALNNWLVSKAHRDALFEPFTDSCLRCKGMYCVQIFAR